MVKYSMATSWDAELVRGVAAANEQAVDAGVDEFYGSFARSLAGSARPAWRLPDVSAEVASDFVTAAAKGNIRFNWTMNAPDLQGRETDKTWLATVRRDLEHVVKMGVSAITIAHPVLIREVRCHFPNLAIKVSLVAGVDTIDMARRFEDMGVACISLNPHTMNRDFDRLHAIRNAVRCDLELYANIPCLQACPYRNAHYCFLGRGSQTMGAPLPSGVDPFLARCSLDYLEDPTRLLSSPFIRPDDIRVYAEMGVNRFKLSDRCESTEFLLATAQAYLSGHFDGDLFALVFRGGAKFRIAMGCSGPETIDAQVHIDNSALSRIGFLRRIMSLSGDELVTFYREAAMEALQIRSSARLRDMKDRIGLNLRHWCDLPQMRQYASLLLVRKSDNEECVS